MGSEVPSSAPEQNEGKQTAQPSWETAPKSEAYLKFEGDYEKEKAGKMGEVDEALANLLAAREFVASYGNERAKALGEMKRYIDLAYKVMYRKMKIMDETPEERMHWENDLDGIKAFHKECIEDITAYKAIIFGMLTEVANRGGSTADEKKIGLDQIFDIARNGKVIYDQMSTDPKYGIIMKKIVEQRTKPLDKDDYKYMVDKLPEKVTGVVTPQEMVNVMRGSGVLTMVYVMNPDQRMIFARKVMDLRPEKSEALLFGLVSGGYLNMDQMEILKPDMPQTLREKMAAAQENALKVQANIHTNIRQDMSTNGAVKFFQEKYLAATALTLWGASNLVLAGTVTILKNGWSGVGEFFGSEWVKLQMGAMVVGSALYGNPTILEWIAKKGDTNESRNEAMVVTNMIMQESHISREYFETPIETKDGKKLGGMMELIAFMRKEKAAKHEAVGKITAKDLLAFANDRNNAGKDPIKYLNPKVKDALAKITGSKDQDGFEKFATAAYNSRVLLDTAQVQSWAKDIRLMEGDKKTQTAAVQPAPTPAPLPNKPS